MESSHRGLRRVAALALEVVASKSETQGHLSGCEGAIRSHLVFFSPDSRDISNTGIVQISSLLSFLKSMIRSVLDPDSVSYEFRIGKDIAGSGSMSKARK